MNDKLTRALAEWEGLTALGMPDWSGMCVDEVDGLTRCPVYLQSEEWEWVVIPTYDWNKLHEILAGFGATKLCSYTTWLDRICRSNEYDDYAYMKPNLPQAYEALAKALGIWTDDMKGEA